MEVREYRSSDCPQMARLFYDTVHNVNAKDYSRIQLDAWADGNVCLEEWDYSFSRHLTLVAVDGDEIVGFGDMDEGGYLDRLYVGFRRQGEGIGTAICDLLESRVRVQKYTVHASLTAKSFFERRGYVSVKKQRVYRRGVELTNFVMEKNCP